MTTHSPDDDAGATAATIESLLRAAGTPGHLTIGIAGGSGSGKVSHVLRAMGVSEADARASIRLGWGRYTSEQDLRDGLDAIKAAARLQGVN